MDEPQGAGCAVCHNCAVSSNVCIAYVQSPSVIAASQQPAGITPCSLQPGCNPRYVTYMSVMCQSPRH